MQKVLGTLTGKTVRAGLKFRRHGGHTLPGLVVEKIFPNYLAKMIGQLPEGVVLITGTNGKTTTTKIVTEILIANGKKVLTNQTGSNLSRGIVSSIARQATASGRLKQDIAILEVDEAQARRLVRQVKPRWVMALNVSRDQLDRFGEVDIIASYIGEAMRAATTGLIVNAGDPNLIDMARQIVSEKNLKLVTFGASIDLAKHFPTDYELAAVNRSVKSREKSAKADIRLTGFKNQMVTYDIEGQEHKAKLNLSGQHNFLNGAAALALCRQILPGTAVQDFISQLAEVSLAFGRGEKYRLKNGAEVELVLVKNPASFTQALASYGAGEEEIAIAINDNIADGRDMSWLWDVNFEPLRGHRIKMTSGRRAADMALRLSYDKIQTGQIEPSLPKALKMMTLPGSRNVFLATYTAMLQLYGILSKQAEKIP